MTTQVATGTAPLIGRGRVLGGSSAINAMLFARGHRDSYADGRTPVPRAGPSTIYCRTSCEVRLPPMVIPYCAEWTDLLSWPRPTRPTKFCVTCCPRHRSVATERRPILAADSNLASARDLTIVEGKRHSAADGYLADALPRPNLDLVSDALVHRVILASGRCAGVDYDIGVGPVAVEAGEVIISAGAIGSPQLLMLSGIGAPAHLRNVGVDVVADLPGVGANLQDHPLSGIIYAAGRSVPAGTRNHGESSVCSVRARLRGQHPTFS